MNKEWYYSIGGNNQGPLSTDQIRALAANGTINGETLVWSSPMTEWLPLSRTELASPQGVPNAFTPRPGVPMQGAGPGMGMGAAMAPAAGSEDTVSDFMSAVRTCLNKYATFSGRAARPEFWWFFLFSMIASVAAGLIDSVITSGGTPILQGIVGLGLIIPQIAVAVRRLHDTDRSGWLYLLIFIPLIGFILLLVWWCQKGTEGQNRFG